jgi:hypothetical protein
MILKAQKAPAALHGREHLFFCSVFSFGAEGPAHAAAAAKLFCLKNLQFLNSSFVRFYIIGALMI